MDRSAQSRDPAELGGVAAVDAANPDLSVVVPVFNEEENLPILAREIEAALDGQSLDGRKLDYEVVWVDDHSTDRSFEVLRELAAKPRHRLLRNRRNRGQSSALVAGFRAARGAVVVTLDADLQNDPADIPRLLRELEGCDLVCGIRTERHDSWLRKVSSRISNRVRDAVIHDGITDTGCSLKAYRREFLRHLPAFDGMHRFLPALARMEGARVREVPVSHRPRIHGESKYGIHNRLWRGIVDLTGVRWLQKRWIDSHLAEEVEPR
jgi:dolichol-phosphate mannosyltransferase